MPPDDKSRYEQFLADEAAAIRRRHNEIAETAAPALGWLGRRSMARRKRSLADSLIEGVRREVEKAIADREPFDRFLARVKGGTQELELVETGEGESLEVVQKVEDRVELVKTRTVTTRVTRSRF